MVRIEEMIILRRRSPRSLQNLWEWRRN